MMSHRVIVVGGGAAGLLAAGSAAQVGVEVLVLEKMERCGRKLLLTGKGRCNLTNTAPLEEFMEHFGRNSRFLRPAFHTFFASDLVALLDELGVETVEERGGRVFPASNDAGEVVEALRQWVGRLGVKIMRHRQVTSILVEDGAVMGVVADGESISARSAIVCTGGASYPATGSTGDGYTMAEALGHHVVTVRPALVPLVTAGHAAQHLQGLSLKNVTAAVLVDGKKSASAFGEMLFTHFGLSGPIILTLSKTAVDALREKRRVEVSIDLKPALDERKLDARLLRDLDAHGKRQFQTLLEDLLPRRLIDVCLEQLRIPADKLAHQISAVERKALRTWLKDFRVHVTGHRRFGEAIVTAGGVDVKEVNPKTMESRLVRGLFFAGEVLDVDADTGGYNLQAAFSTGWLAGLSSVSSRD